MLLPTGRWLSRACVRGVCIRRFYIIKDRVLLTVGFASVVFIIVYAVLAFQKEKRARVVWMM